MKRQHVWQVGSIAVALCGCSNEALIGLSTSQGNATRPLDFCSELPELGLLPIIDGLSDLDAAPVALSPHTWRDAQNPLPSSHAAEYRIAWTPQGVYFHVEVQVPELRPSTSELLWCGDAVHLFLDGDGRYTQPPGYDVPGTRQFIVTAPADASPNTTRAGFTDSESPTLDGWSSTRYGAFPRPGGYSVEALITDADLGAQLAAAPGSSVGFSVSVSFSGIRTVPNAGDGACEGLRLGDLTVALGQGDCVSPHCNVNAFCSPLLATTE